MSPPGRAAAPELGTGADGQSGWQARLDPEDTSGLRQRPAGLMPPCRWCGRPTLRTDSAGQPAHSVCEPADTGLTDRPTAQMAAATGARGIGSPLARAVLDLLRLAEEGLTDDELHRLMPDELLGSIAKRRLDLVRAGLVEDTGRTRLTRRGVPAVVWAVAR